MYQYIYYHKAFRSIVITINANRKSEADAVLHNAGLLDMVDFIERVKN